MTPTTPDVALRLPPEGMIQLAPDEWTAPFWEAAAQHRLVVPRCTTCGAFRFPPSPFSWRGPAQTLASVQPEVGQDHAYTRWYEDDHFYSGAMTMPWMFAGRRWVATRALQELRYPDPSVIAEPLAAGKYLATYWITDGRYEDHLRWTVATNQRLLPDGRIYLDRTHMYTSFQQYTGAVYRDPTGPRDIHSLDHPYQGLVLEVVDPPPDSTRAPLDRGLPD